MFKNKKRFFWLMLQMLIFLAVIVYLYFRFTEKGPWQIISANYMLYTILGYQLYLHNRDLDRSPYNPKVFYYNPTLVYFIKYFSTFMFLFSMSFLIILGLNTVWWQPIFLFIINMIASTISLLIDFMFTKKQQVNFCIIAVPILMLLIGYQSYVHYARWLAGSSEKIPYLNQL